MNIEFEKKQIIEQILGLQDEWLIKAIRKLLDLDYEDDINEEHKLILNDRIKSYETNPADVIDWEEFKGNLRKK